jgi:hypothetical protein
MRPDLRTFSAEIFCRLATGPWRSFSLGAKRSRVLCRFRCLRAQLRGRPNRCYGKRGTRHHRQQATRRHAHSTAPQLARIECGWRSHFPGQARPGPSPPSVPQHRNLPLKRKGVRAFARFGERQTPATRSCRVFVSHAGRTGRRNGTRSARRGTTPRRQGAPAA